MPNRRKLEPNPYSRKEIERARRESRVHAQELLAKRVENERRLEFDRALDEWRGAA